MTDSRNSNPRRRFLGTVVSATLLAGVVVAGGPRVAAADRETADLTTTDLSHCTSGVACTFAIGGMPVTTDERVQIDRDEAGSVVVRGTVHVGPDGAGWTLASSELAFAAHEGGHRYVAGAARFDDIETPVLDLVDLPHTALGIASGADLAALGAHVRPGATYWYFHAAAGISIGPGSLLAGTSFGFEPLPLPAEASVVFVLDPTDPYVYLGGSCDVISTIGSKLTGSDRSDDSDDSDDSDADPVEDASGGHPEEPDRGDEAEPRAYDEIVATLATFTDGDCGLGVSGNGLIPADGIAGTAPYGAHVVLDAPLPPVTGISVDGTTTMRFDRGLRLTGRGDLSVGVEPFGSLLGASLPLGSATADLEITEGRFGVAIDGVLATQDGYELPLLREPVVFPADAHVRVSGRFGAGTGAGGRVDPDSFIEFGGDLAVLGADLASASARVDRHGATVGGFMTTGITTYEMTGRLDADGAELTGRASVDVPLNLIGEAADATIAAADEAQADVDRLDGEIAAMRATVRAERHRASVELTVAARDVSAARDSLTEIDRNISINDSKVSYLQRRISRERSWYRRLPWYRKPSYAARHAGRVAAWSTAIGGLRTANAANVAARDTTHAALQLAEQTVVAVRRGLDALPTDADPRIVALITARDVATGVLTATAAAAAPFRNSRSYQGSIEMRLGTAGTAGAFDLVACDAGSCTTVAAGSISWEAGRAHGCVVPAAGASEVCVDL